jgi:thiosulfate dehydrogenase (quinone) large subunit
MSEHVMKTTGGQVVTNPPIARLLFDDTRFGIVWLIVRILVGWDWFEAGWGKLNNPAWMQTGDALKGFWSSAVQVPDTGRPPITFDWYRNFIQSLLAAGAYVWFAKVIAIGETLVGAALILGIFVGIAAFLGGFMNWNYIMAGSASTNPLLFVGALLLIMAWKTGGYWGVDRFLLPWLGTPWGHKEPSTPSAPNASGGG